MQLVAPPVLIGVVRQNGRERVPQVYVVNVGNACCYRRDHRVELVDGGVHHVNPIKEARSRSLHDVWSRSSDLRKLSGMPMTNIWVVECVYINEQPKLLQTAISETLRTELAVPVEQKERLLHGIVLTTTQERSDLVASP